MMKKDYYKILEVSKSDSIDVIKKKYKKLALKYHPDRAAEGKREEFEEKFKDINEAYNTLSDPAKKSQYDSGGQSFRGQSGGQGRGDFSDIFESLFRNQMEEESLDLQYSIVIDFKEAAFGCEKEVSVKKDVKCSTCQGSGSKDEKFDTCKKCSGQGVIEVNQRTPFGVMARAIKCESCFGQGKTPKVKCSSCRGKGIVNESTKVKVSIPAGIDDGQTMRIPNSGNANRDGRSGDLFLTIRIKPHPVFKREGFNIFMNLEISFSQAALGCEIEVPTLKDKVKIKIAKGSETGNVLRLTDQGIPYLDNPNYVGDEYVKIIVKTPKKLSKAQSDLFKELAKLDK